MCGNDHQFKTVMNHNGKCEFAHLLFKHISLRQYDKRLLNFLLLTLENKFAIAQQ